MAIAPEQIGIGIGRYFTRPGTHPYDMVEWERREARIQNYKDGTDAFFQPDVEFPTTWSQNATNIVAQKYFRGTLGTPERETSVRQVIDRIADTITAWGVRDGYFVDEHEGAAFRNELKFILLTQRAAFNSPVWFNIGVKGVPQQSSACQPYSALVSTVDGLVPIGKLVEDGAIGTKVFDAHGITKVVALKANGRKEVLRAHTKAGLTLDVTADHLVWRGRRGEGNGFVEAGTLRPGDQLEWYQVESLGSSHVLTSAVVDCEIERIEALGEMHVYDIQTESGEYLSNNLRVHNCFILAVEDTMDGILNWYREEGIIFKGGSGAGINLSSIRSSRELLQGGGTPSGPVSFMRGADSSAGTIRSGGKTRRAAKMVILNADHPDVEEFIWCKALEERKARALRDAGFDMDLDGKDSYSIQYQNANNSVRVTDAFMQAVLEDRDWHLNAITTGETIKTVKARELMRQISEATWECADPGMQFDTTINHWHTAPNTGRINGSNPCCFVGDTLVDAAGGMIRFELLEKMAAAGEQLPEVRAFDATNGRHVFRRILNVWVAGRTTHLVDVRTEAGVALRCTPEHPFLLRDGSYVEARSLTVGSELRAVDGPGRDALDRVASIGTVTLDDEEPVFDLEVEGTHNFAVSSDGQFIEHSVIVHNSEYMHLDNSACNLASINLLKYLDADDDDTFDVEAFKHTVEVLFTAQEILVGNADYPTEKIADNSRKFRQLGLGYANLGALLMAQGMPYDSDDGRAWASAITALMTGHAYATSARTAGRMGPFAGFAENAEPMINVLRMHRAEVAKVDEELVPPDLLGAAQRAWDEAVELGERFGVRNSQATVIAPTGTISLALDCDTTGIEPDLALTKAKKLVGGGTMFIVNQTIPRALRRMGYSDDQIDAIVAYIDEHKTIIGAPSFNPEHLPVFACSMGDNPIQYMGHVTMMAAVQPWISGSISKSVNTPEETTVEELEDLHIAAWKLGLKSVAIYRDNCKVGQPLSTQKKAGAETGELTGTVERIVEHVIVQEPVRQKLPRTRNSKTFSFRVADCRGFATVAEYEDGRPGELFLHVSKQGSTLAGIMDSFAIAVSHGLQYGVPLRAFIDTFTNRRFEPAGMTDDPDLRIATSLVDYLFRKLAIEYLPYEERAEIGVLTTGERMQPTLPGVEESIIVDEPGLEMLPLEDRAPSAALPVPPAPIERQPPRSSEVVICHVCGDIMQRAGSCHACPSCGATSGCS